MKIDSGSLVARRTLWAILVVGMVIALASISVIANRLFLVILILTILSTVFILWPKRLFFFFMLLFVFGEVSFGSYFLQISLSNYFIVLVMGIIVLYASIGGKRFFHLSTKGAGFGKVLLIFFVLSFISAVANSDLRSQLTTVSYVLSSLAILVIGRNQVTLLKGFSLGVISIGLLSALTILNGLDLLHTGYRAPVSWGSSPWEEIIPRSIGLPNMGGGLHSIFVLSFLPFAILRMGSNNRDLKRNSGPRIVSILVSLLGISALLVASFRSGWIGLVVSMLCLIWLGDIPWLRTRTHKMLLLLLGLGLLVIVALLFQEPIIAGANNLLFNVRSQGVEARLLQYQYVLQRMLVFSTHTFIGYGYSEFSQTFLPSVSAINNPELYPWLHNFYLGILYAFGWPTFLVLILLILYSLRELHTQAKSKDYLSRLLGRATFSSICGILVVLAFTAEVSGLQIFWILLAVAFIPQSIHNEKIPNDYFLGPSS